MANRAILKTYVQLFFLLIAAAFIASCATTKSPPTKRKYPELGEVGRAPKSPPTKGEYPKSRKAPKSLPTVHLWQYLYSYGAEDHGYATYSYVLVGRDKNNPDATSLYRELVKAIQGSTSEADSIPEHVPHALFNLFLLPAKMSGETGKPEPNYELSRLLLDALSTTSPLKFFRPGPYIITLYQPVSFDTQDDIADILYIDLTNMHPVAIPEVVSAYKRKILAENLSGIEKLHSLRLSLLNIALIAEDSIGFAKVAYAELRSAFSE